MTSRKRPCPVTTTTKTATMGACFSDENPSKQAASTSARARASAVPMKKKAHVAHDAQGQVFIYKATAPITNDYTFGAQLGAGQYGVTFKCTHKESGAVRAVKKLSKTTLRGQKPQYVQQQVEAMRNEILILQSVEHPNICKLFDLYEDESDLYLVLELCEGKELFDRITERRHYTEMDACFVIKQICEGLEFLHKRKIAHCDLKPDNFLFKTMEEKSALSIIDFGMSKRLRTREKLHNLRGTPYYIAPEVLRYDYSEACDMWSVGVVMFVMLCGFPPFVAETDDEIYKKIEKGFFPMVKDGYGPWFPKTIPLSKAAMDLITKLLDPDTAKRLTASEALDHPWLQGGKDVPTTPLPTDVLKGLAQVAKRTKFTTGVLAFLSKCVADGDNAESLGGREETTRLMKMFNEIDTNGDGLLSSEEIAAALTKTKNASQKAEIENLVKIADEDGDGQLSVKELMMAATSRYLISKEERLWRAFQMLDKDKSGLLTRVEIAQALNLNVGSAELDDVINEVDIDKSGTINYDEFLTVFLGKDTKTLDRAMSQ